MTQTDDTGPGGLAQLGELLKAVRRRWLLVVVVVVAAGAAALALTLRQTPQYDAVAKIVIRESDPLSSLSTTGARPSDPERDFNTRVQLVEQPDVAERVRTELRLPLSIDELLAKIRTEVSATSDIASIRARDPDPRRAAAIANAVARAYVEIREQAVRTRILDAISLAARQLAGLSAAERAAPSGRELAQRLGELQIDAALQTSGVEVVSLAIPPTSPATPKPVLTTALAVFLAGLIGVALAVALELGDRRLKEEADLDSLGMPLLGSVPPARHAATDEDFAVREALSTLATNVRFLHQRRDVGALIVTSPGPREDTAEVTLGLACALTELGVGVIVIEADLRRPQLADYVELSPATGLSTVLAGFSDVDDVLIEVDVEQLRRAGADTMAAGLTFALIPAGPVAPSPLRLLTSPTMAEVVRRARDLADVVILDTAPADTVGDAASLAELVDGIVVVTKLGHTRRDALQRALRALTDLHAPILGLVLTDAPRPQRASYGGEPPTRTRGLVSP